MTRTPCAVLVALALFVPPLLFGQSPAGDIVGFISSTYSAKKLTTTPVRPRDLDAMHGDMRRGAAHPRLMATGRGP